ncbi:pre-mRNA-splicing factor SLU7-like protein [Tanacetum coccineum]
MVVERAIWQSCCVILRFTHEAKECVERTQKVGAKWMGENIAPDEKIEKIVFDYDGKRDRWNSYDAISYVDVIYRYEAHDNQNKVSGQALEFKQTNMHALAQFYLLLVFDYSLFSSYPGQNKQLKLHNEVNTLNHKLNLEEGKLYTTLDAEVKRWSSGKQGYLHALLSSLQYADVLKRKADELE